MHPGGPTSSCPPLFCVTARTSDTNSVPSAVSTPQIHLGFVSQCHQVPPWCLGLDVEREPGQAAGRWNKLHLKVRPRGGELLLCPKLLGVVSEPGRAALVLGRPRFFPGAQCHRVGSWTANAVFPRAAQIPPARIDTTAKIQPGVERISNREGTLQEEAWRKALGSCARVSTEWTGFHNLFE